MKPITYYYYWDESKNLIYFHDEEIDNDSLLFIGAAASLNKMKTAAFLARTYPQIKETSLKAYPNT